MSAGEIASVCLAVFTFSGIGFMAFGDQLTIFDDTPSLVGTCFCFVLTVLAFLGMVGFGITALLSNL